MIVTGETMPKKHEKNVSLFPGNIFGTREGTITNCVGGWSDLESIYRINRCN